MNSCCCDFVFQAQSRLYGDKKAGYISVIRTVWRNPLVGGRLH